MKVRNIALLFASAAVLSALFYPTKVIVAPEWDVRVIDYYDRPVVGANLMEDWRQYSVENRSHEEDRVTAIDGTAHFPLRTMRASLAHRLTGCLANVLEEGVHASCGGHAYLVGTKDGRTILRDTGGSWSGGPKRITATILN